MKVFGGPALLSALVLATASGLSSSAGPSATNVSAVARHAPPNDPAFTDAANGADWISYGRTYDEQHHSPLREINRANIGRLGLAWSLELPGLHSAATVPLAVDGVLYFAADQAIVHAVDAVTGKLLWTYNPDVAKVAGIRMRGQWGTRGLAFGYGKLFVGTQDGRLIAVDSRTGKPVWSVQTVEAGDGRYITGAPRVFNGLVLIGHAGADMAPVRGYVTAYDVATGAQRWRFHAVPGDPAKGFENAAMAMAAKTWTGEYWKYGGGGTVWNAMTYDPDFNTIYLGTGNGAPWNSRIRSPGGGDNLFLASIVALDADTGAYKWHYQQNPAETWDYNSAMDITLATLTIDGAPRKVLMQAPKNGFFYIIDRATGKLLSAEKFAKATWASHVDLDTGRPVELPNVRYDNSEVHLWPSPSGAHSWQPMAYNPHSGLVYIPTIELAGSWDDRGIDRKRWASHPGQMNAGIHVFQSDIPPAAGTSSLLAWDPVRQRKVWEVKTPGVWNGGVMTTAGGLVFQGQGDGMFNAYAADTGKPLWRFDGHMGIVGAPITYIANGRQYVTILAGWGGSGAGFMGSLSAQYGWVARKHTNRVLTFAMDGRARLPANLPPPGRELPIDDPAFALDQAKAERGAALYSSTCMACHGSGVVAAGYAPDLRASPVPLAEDLFKNVVHGGLLLEQGMPTYGELTDSQLEELRHYIRARARETIEPRPKRIEQGRAGTSGAGRNVDRRIALTLRRR
ncbi:MAG: quinohemoprotein ethanol dehydrogenase [Alphaproteobacteria bacterium]|nr:quinohemoprotein ethanol dehydrogenase [Alphaproteobacteria bacterium]